MRKYPHLEHAPITEALIDIRIIPTDDDDDVSQRMNKAVIAGYPKKQEMRLQGNHFKIPATEAEAQNILRGLRFTSDDEKQVFQAKFDGFTFSRLEPYLDWENLVTSAKHLWTQYLDLVGDVQATRIAVRFINRIEVPTDTSLNAYFVALPSRPEELPAKLISFLSRTAIPFTDEDAIALITQSMNEVKPDAATIILDIDVFKESKYDNSSEDLWADLEDLRNIKNLVFFKSLTTKAIDTYRV